MVYTPSLTEIVISSIISCISVWLHWHLWMRTKFWTELSWMTTLLSSLEQLLNGLIDYLISDQFCNIDIV